MAGVIRSTVTLKQIQAKITKVPYNQETDNQINLLYIMACKTRKGTEAPFCNKQTFYSEMPTLNEKESS